ncbi:MAG: hypothetical protein V3W44_04335 [Dehalococcoidales bacterium]
MKKVIFCYGLLLGLLLGVWGNVLSAHYARDRAQAIQHGAREAYLQILCEVVGKELIRGPLEVNEPGTTVKDCAFFALDGLLEIGADYCSVTECSFNLHGQGGSDGNE